MTDADKILEAEFGIVPLPKKLCRYRKFSPCIGRECPEYRQAQMQGTPPGGPPKEIVFRLCVDDFVTMQLELLARNLDDIKAGLIRLMLVSGVAPKMPPPIFMPKQ